MGLKDKFDSFMRHRQEKKLLDDINSRLPKHIDWKAGAREYLSRIINAEGGHNRRFELVKPFLGGPDYSSFYTDMYSFTNIVEKLNLGMNSRILDVGCGGGWVTQFLARLGHHLTGIDISEELLEIARERMAFDMYPPYENEPFHVDFACLDVEEEAPETDEQFDCVLFMSVLHHFFNPIRAIRNATAHLADNGLLAIVEAAAPESDSVHDRQNRDIMEKYHTIERPLSRDQMQSVLEMCGFPHYHFYQPVNGLFRPTQAAVNHAETQIMYRNWNIVIASRTRDVLPDALHQALTVTGSGSIEFLKGFYDAETEPGWGDYRWSGPESWLETHNLESLTLEIQGVFMDPETARIKIFIRRDASLAAARQNDIPTGQKSGSTYGKLNGQKPQTGWLTETRILTRDNPTALIELSGLGPDERLCLMADYVFRPDWFGIPDTRLLSFKLKLPSADSTNSEPA